MSGSESLALLSARARRLRLPLMAALAVCSCGRLGFVEHSAPHDAGTRVPVAEPDAGVSLDAGTTVQGGAGELTLDAGRCPQRQAVDFCEELPALQEDPTLDGELDCGPELRELPQRGWTGMHPLAGDQRARYAVAWRPQGLYFYVEVDDHAVLPAPSKDGHPWCGDGVELYADADGHFAAPPAYDDPGTMQLLAAAPAASPTDMRAPDVRFHTRSELEVGEWSSARHGVWLRDGGYALEAFVTAEDLGLPELSLAAGGRVGMDVAINVSVPTAAQSGQADCGYREGQYFLRVASEPCTTESCRPFTNVAAFCTPSLAR